MKPDFDTLPRHSENAQFARFDHHDVIELAGTSLVVPHVALKRPLQPEAWFSSKFAGGKVHEPRLVDVIAELALRAGDRPVRFYDIGALFGVFAVLAAKLFAQAEVVAVEPDAEAARFIRAMAKANGISIAVEQVLLTGAAGEATFAADGFRYAEDPDEGRLRTAALADILLPRSECIVEILKIDTEGHQALFLPQAAEELAARAAIVMLELDRPEKLAQHGSSNAAVVAPFLAQGYELWWCDHRDPKGKIERLAQLSAAEERNSLAILLAPRLS